jgi:hypothetical protein
MSITDRGIIAGQAEIADKKNVEVIFSSHSAVSTIISLIFVAG